MTLLRAKLEAGGEEAAAAIRTIVDTLRRERRAGRTAAALGIRTQTLRDWVRLFPDLADEIAAARREISDERRELAAIKKAEYMREYMRRPEVRAHRRAKRWWRGETCQP